MAGMALEPVYTQCPYCGESIELLIDCSEDEQVYIEDCQVCCRPMNVYVSVDTNGRPYVRLTNENDA